MGRMGRSLAVLGSPAWLPPSVARAADCAPEAVVVVGAQSSQPPWWGFDICGLPRTLLGSLRPGPARGCRIGGRSRVLDLPAPRSEPPTRRCVSAGPDGCG